VLRALLDFEIERILELAQAEESPTQALARISMEISTDPALTTMRTYDPAFLTQLLSAGADPLWQKCQQGLVQLLRSPQTVELALRWLIGQIFAPLTPEQSVHQASVIAG